MRRTADRVDDQMVDYLKQNAIEGPWQSAERLLVCVGADALSEKVVRTASRLASGLNAPWLVVSHRAQRRLDRARSRTAASTSCSSLAERLGAETRRVTGGDFVEEILKVARREHATQIVIGAPRQPFWTRYFGQSLAEAVMERAGGVGVHVVTAEDGAAPHQPCAVQASRLSGSRGTSASPSAASPRRPCSGCAIKAFVPLPNVSMLFLLAVLVSAIYAGHAGSAWGRSAVGARLQFLLHRPGRNLHHRAAA